MPKGISLSDFEKGQISAKHDQGLSNRQIARDLGRHHKVIGSYLKNPAGYGTKSHSGRPPLLSDREKRRILREASNKVTTCSKMKAELKLNVSAETVRRVICKSNFIKWRKMKKAPKLERRHKDNRLSFARRNQRTDWKQVRTLMATFSLLFLILGGVFR